MSEEKKYEDHHIILTMEHEMKIDGHYLTEKIKQTTLIESLNPESIGDQTIVREQTQSIDDKFYKSGVHVLLSKIYPDSILILSWFYLDKIWIKSE